MQHQGRGGDPIEPVVPVPLRRAGELGDVPLVRRGEWQPHRPVLLDAFARGRGGVVERDGRLCRLPCRQLPSVAQHRHRLRVHHRMRDAGMRGEQAQRANPIRRGEGDLLRHQAAHGDAHDVGAPDLRRVQDGQAVRGHRLHGVRRSRHVTGVAGTPVVDPDHAVALGESGHLAEPHRCRVAQPHDQQNCLAVVGAVGLPRDAGVVRTFEQGHGRSLHRAWFAAVDPAMTDEAERSQSPAPSHRVPWDLPLQELIFRPRTDSAAPREADASRA